MISYVFFYIALLLMIVAFIIKQRVNKIYLYFACSIIINFIFVKNFYDVIIIVLISIAYFLFLMYITEDKNAQ